jgi:hypothetical protein
MEGGTVACIMRLRLTHEYLPSPPHASCLFLEEGPGYRGLRLFLNKDRKDENAELIASMNRRNLKPELDAQKGPRQLVSFAVEKVPRLIGGAGPPVTGKYRDHDGFDIALAARWSFPQRFRAGSQFPPAKCWIPDGRSR